jgi:nucleoside-diphosphate-sugar epimerase
VYAEPDDPDRVLLESDPLGGGAPTPYSPTYRVSKLGQEAVARFCAEEFDLPTLIARINVVYGDNGGLPAMLLDGMLAGRPVPLGPHGATRPSPIHHDDLFAHLPGLVAGASVPATIVNWGGDEPVDLREMCRFMAELVGCDARFVESAETSGTRPSDPTRRIALAGPCRVDWRDGIRRMLVALHPERLSRARARAPGARGPGGP